MKNRIILCLIFFAVFAAAAFSETPQPAPGEPNSKDTQYRKKLHDRVFLLVAWELADEMQLPPEKEEQFLAALKEHFREKGNLVSKQAEIIQSIKNSYKNANPKNDKDLQAELKKLDDIRERQQKLEKDFDNKLKDILTVEQQARFVIAWPHIQEKIKQRLMEKKQKRVGKIGRMNGKGKKMSSPDENQQPSK